VTLLSLLGAIVMRVPPSSDELAVAAATTTRSCWARSARPLTDSQRAGQRRRGHVPLAEHAVRVEDADGERADAG
jgi:hypothetical protein